MLKNIADFITQEILVITVWVILFQTWINNARISRLHKLIIRYAFVKNDHEEKRSEFIFDLINFVLGFFIAIILLSKFLG